MLTGKQVYGEGRKSCLECRDADQGAGDGSSDPFPLQLVCLFQIGNGLVHVMEIVDGCMRISLHDVIHEMLLNLIAFLDESDIVFLVMISFIFLCVCVEGLCSEFDDFPGCGKRIGDGKDRMENTKSRLLRKIRNGTAQSLYGTDGNGTVLFENLPLREGKNLFTVTGYTENGILLTEQAVFEKTEMPEPSYVLPDSHAGETVQNWFLEEEGVDLDQYFSVRDRAEDLMEQEECHRILKKYLPEVVTLLEKEIIPLGLSLNSIISRSQKEGQKIDVRALNGELMRVAKER